MCGFIGMAWAGGAREHDERALASWLPDLAHRGPDGHGVFAEHGLGIAATRLAIQGDARALPPVQDARGRFVLAFNGEILAGERARLRRLLVEAGGVAPAPAAGDAPLLVETIAAIAEARGVLDGPRLGDLLEGSMGALALLDLRERTLWLARDRLGIKPLHVAPVADGLLFASEIRPLLRARGTDVRLDPEGMAELWRWQRPVRSLPFGGVESLAPGAVWRVRPGGRITRWMGGRGVRDLVERSSGDGTGVVERAVAEFGRAFDATARAAAEGEGTITLLLSGGLDSGAVALAVGRDEVRALTGRFPPWDGTLDESASARLVASAAGLPHEVLDLGDRGLLEDLDAVVRSLEIPMAGPGALALWRVLRRAREHGRIVLTGTGGDELLGGYTRTALVLGRNGPFTRGYEGLHERIEAAGADPAARQYAVLDRSADLAPLLDPAFSEALPRAEPPGSIARGLASGADLLDELVAEEIEGTLPVLLHVEDRLTMAHGLEGRPVPCLGEVPRAAARLPLEALVGADGEGKRALRLHLAGRMPDAVRLDPGKRGFPTPFARAARGEGRDLALAVIEDRRFRERGWWNVMACRAAFDEERPLFDRGLYAMLSWELWARAFLDGDALGTTKEHA